MGVPEDLDAGSGTRSPNNARFHGAARDYHGGRHAPSNGQASGRNLKRGQGGGVATPIAAFRTPDKMHMTAKTSAAFLRTLLPAAAVCAVALGAVSAAKATTYAASRAVGDGFVDLSITTDDTLGVLSTGNILDLSLIHI